jgi:hypothetical protein
MGSAKDEFLKAIQPPRKPDPMDVLKPPPVRMPQKVIEKIDFTPFGTVMRRGLSSVRGYLTASRGLIWKERIRPRIKKLSSNERRALMDVISTGRF